MTVSPVPAYGGTVSGEGAFTDGSQQTVTATATPGYNFINWTENGIEVSSSTNYAFMLTANRALVANFTATPFILSDRDAPALLITQPYSSGVFVTTTNAVTLAGTASDLGHGDNGIAIVTVNGIEATGDSAANGGTANWSLLVGLGLGTNVFTVIARDNSPSANSTTTTLLINYQPSPQLIGMNMSNGVFQFVLNGLVGSNYVVKVSTNLVDWSPLSTNTISAGGWAIITDPEATNMPRRFYRAVAP